MNLIAGREVVVDGDTYAGETDDYARRARATAPRQACFIELAPPVLARALEPFPCRARTLDAMHPASMEFLRECGQEIRPVPGDSRMLECAAWLRIPLSKL